MMVRRATADDVPLMVRLGEAFHSKMTYNRHPFRPEIFEESLKGYMELDEFALWVGDDAMAAAMIGQHPATGVRMASEIFLYSEGASQGLRLLREMKNWAKANGASDLILTDQINMRDLAALYERAGAVPVERVYRAEL